MYCSTLRGLQPQCTLTCIFLRERFFALLLRHILQNNAGEQSGAIYAHGLQDGDLANGDPSTVGCSVRLSNSTLEGNMGTHAGAVYMS